VGVAIAVEASVRTAAYCAAGRGAKAEEDPATCVKGRNHGRRSGHQEACRLGPCPRVSCPEAYLCLADDDAFGLTEEVYAVAP
jgi:hypothetical protein